MADYNERTVVKDEERSFDLQGLIFEYLAQWKWFVLSIILCAAAAYYHVSTMIPMYSVGASIYLSQDKASKSSMAALGERSIIDTNPYIDQTEIEILKSRNNLIRIVDSLDMEYSYFHVGKLRDVPIYGNNAVVASLDSTSLRNLSSPITVLLSKDDKKYHIHVDTYYGGVEEKRSLEADSLPVAIELSHGTLRLVPSRYTARLDGTQKILIENPSWVAARLSQSIDIKSTNASGILHISCNTTLVPQGIDVIKTLVAVYNHDIIAEQNLSAIQTEAFIIDRLAMVARELQDVEKEVENYRRDKRIVTDISTEVGRYYSQTAAADERIAEIDLESQIIDNVEKILDKQDDYTPVPQLINDESLNTLIVAYNKKLAQRAALMEGGTENNPLIRTMQDDLTRAKSEIYRGIENVKRGLRIRRNDVQRKDNIAVGQLSNMPVYERELTGIFREQRIKDNIYNFLLEKREEIALQKTLATPTARFIDTPSGGTLISPFRTMYVGVGIIIGLLIPAVIIFLRRMVFPIFKDKDDLERVTNIPILGEISTAPKDEEFVIAENKSTPIAELFRLLRNNIQFAMADNEKKVIIVTSSLSGEGKTFIACNLALAFALTGKKTVVVGLDIRRPVLAHKFGYDNHVGVTTYLSAQVDKIDDMVYKSGLHDNLYVLPSGPIPPNPNELLMGKRCTELFAELRAKFDIVIVDTAPVGVISDTFLVAPHSDIQLYVARANYSTKRCLNVLHQAVTGKRLPDCYLVLNAVDMRSGSYAYRKYGYYGHYGKYGQQGKGSAYGYGYNEETPSLKSRLKRLKRRIFKK